MANTSLQKRFVIVGVARSGTTALHSILKSHPEIKMPPNESRVSPLFTEGLGSFFPNGFPKHFKLQTIEVAFDAATSVSTKKIHLWNGVKVSLITPEDAKSLVKAMSEHLPGSLMIYIEREDEIARTASMRVADLTNVWHTTKEDLKQSKGNIRIWISPHTLKHGYIMAQQCNNILRNFPNESIYKFTSVQLRRG